MLCLDFRLGAEISFVVAVVGVVVLLGFFFVPFCEYSCVDL